MFPIINIGPLSFPAPELILLLGLLLSSNLADRKSREKGRKPEIPGKIIWTSFIAGLVGAKLSFIARNPGAVQDQWFSILTLNRTLMDPAGGIVIALAAGYLTASKNKVISWSLLDDLVPFFAALLPALFLANFASGSGFGMLTNLPWGIAMWGGSRHPVQLYYFLCSLGVLTWIAIRSNPLNLKPGSHFTLFVFITSGYLTFFSAFQDPAGYLIGGFRISQLVFWALFSFCAFLVFWKYHKGVSNASR